MSYTTTRATSKIVTILSVSELVVEVVTYLTSYPTSKTETSLKEGIIARITGGADQRVRGLNLMHTAAWNQFKTRTFFDRESGLFLDWSKASLDDSFTSDIFGRVERALAEMQDLEKGAIANPDEGRMVGHYWLRDPEKAPADELKNAINRTVEQIERFTGEVHEGRTLSSNGKPFKHLLLVGIGGSALGPQFIYRALGSVKDKMSVFFFDNTDPEGMKVTLDSIPDLGATLCLVISKSGGTKETRNGSLIAREAFTAAGLDFSQHFVAVTGEGSELDRQAASEGWLARFPMWDWVGGRTSVFSAVGLLPAALQGVDVREFLKGAKHSDVLTRSSDPRSNPAMMLALAWYALGQGRGAKDMVILPYNDRLELFSRYLQQLVMESLGKELDREGRKVEQGIAVYGNKGSTDQHAYVQQLRDGVNNFFAVFIQVLEDATPYGGPSNYAKVEVEEGITSGDYLHGFLLGTRRALGDKQRPSITLSIQRVDGFNVGLLIALFERAVGFYASLINVNAYHQPGVEAGKKAAATVLELQKKVFAALGKAKEGLTVDEMFEQVSANDYQEEVFHILRHLQANGRVHKIEGQDLFADRYKLV